MSEQDRNSSVPVKRRRSRRWAWFALKWGAVGGIWGGFFVLLFVAWCAYDLPDVSKLNEIKRRPSVTLIATDGSIIASYGDLYGTTVGLAQMPPYLPQAVIATEDRRFYSHFGLDLIGLARAVYVNLRAGTLVQGGSSITQQLAKNIFLTPERSLHRKGQEVLLALWLERNFTKDQILELYLNRVYFGAGTYGVDAASRKYFDRPVGEITLFEAAMLAGMLKAPSKYNPFNDKALAKTRAALVIRSMVSAGYLGEAEADQAVSNTAPSVAAKAKGQIGQYFADWMLDQVSSFVGYSDQDLVVQTTLDNRIQALAEQDVAAAVAELGPKMHASQAALVAMTPDGAIRAMVGGTDYRASQFNRATQALRQPGSAFKAFVFLAGFEAGFTPESEFVDGPIQIGKWRPSNYQDKFYGSVDLREAFARSMNSIAVQLSEQTGRRNVIETAKRLGIASPLGNDPSIALGTSEVTALEMTGAYATFANQGNGVLPYGIESIATRDGQAIYQRSGGGLGRVASPQAVREMLDVMAAVVDHGTGRKAQIDRPAVGKTGTSQDYRDAWFIGLTADLVAGVWVGNDDNSAMDRVTGGTIPVRIWHDFMTDALQGVPARDIPVPGGSGTLFAANTPAAVPQPVAPAAAEAPGTFEQLLNGLLGGGAETPAPETAAPKPQDGTYRGTKPSTNRDNK